MKQKDTYPSPASCTFSVDLVLVKDAELIAAGTEELCLSKQQGQHRAGSARFCPYTVMMKLIDKIRRDYCDHTLITCVVQVMGLPKFLPFELEQTFSKSIHLYQLCDMMLNTVCFGLHRSLSLNQTVSPDLFSYV